MARLLICGPRDASASLRQMVNNYVVALAGVDVVIVTGGAVGVDRVAETAARLVGIEVERVEPDYATHGRVAPLVRDRAMVDATDGCLAFCERWPRLDGGTGYTSAYARRRGKPTFIASLGGDLPSRKWLAQLSGPAASQLSLFG